VEVLPEPVETEGWTNADLLEKRRAHPGIYYKVSSEIPDMLGLGASAAAALLKRLKIVGGTRPLRDEQLRNVFGPGLGLVKRKVGPECSLDVVVLVRVWAALWAPARSWR
jgi:hypothetical protein